MHSSRHITGRFLPLLAALAVAASADCAAQSLFREQELPNPGNTPSPVFPVPTERQMQWFETEFYGFSHYGPNTFVGTEWGNDRPSDPTEFAPATLPDCQQWADAMAAAGMRGAVIISKHHDGFCLWPTGSTEFNVLHGAGVSKEVNILKQFADACRANGMKFGVYVSPWDASSPLYATDAYVTDVLLKQITEICSGYGPMFEIWFDGAMGGGGYYGGSEMQNRTIDKTVYYDWENVADSIHKMQPGCVVWGREFRWCGNEDGFSGRTCWANFNSKEVFIEQQNNTGVEDGLLFIPSESDVRTTSKWFWTAEEKAKTPEQLFKIYLETIGRNSTLIMNCAPDDKGKMPDNVVESLKGLGKLLDERLAKDFAAGRHATADKVRTPGDFGADNVTDGCKDTYWTTNDGDTSGSVTIDLKRRRGIHYVMLQEYIRLGQRVRAFDIETSIDGRDWQPFAEGTTIGYKRIMAKDDNTDSYGEATEARYVRVNIRDSHTCPLLHTISIY